ncbi:MAG TPA: J domain-containing protein [Blastocatellia bacterium]|nr:J domain-containing protein [Blastocatellia bacterium]
MSEGLILSNAAEQQEIERKRAALAELTVALKEREAELAGLRAELRAFEGRYLEIIGSRYDELAEIEKQIATLQGLSPDDEVNIGSLADDEVGCGQNRFHSDRLRKLYREVCRRFHPDLSADEREREHRHHLMVEINRAYETGAEERLQALLEAGAGLTEVEAGSESATELILLARRLAETRERLLALDQEIETITSSETWRLRLRVINAEAMGVDLFTDLIAQVDRQITKARNRLEALQSVMLTA